MMELKHRLARCGGLLLVAALLGTSGCSRQTESTYQVSDARDHFSETVDGQTIDFANWQLDVANRRIDIPPVPSTIIIRRSGRGLSIDVNGRIVYQK